MYSMVYDDSVSDSGGGLGFEDRAGYLLARLGSLSERSWVAMLRQRGLTAHQHGVLLALREHGPIAQQSLARVIAVDPRNVVPIIDGLAAKGLIERGMDPTDRRRRVVALTATGKDAAEDLAAAAAEIEDDFLAALTPADRRELGRILQILHTSLT